MLILDPDGMQRCRLSYQMPNEPDAYGLQWTEVMCAPLNSPNLQVEHTGELPVPTGGRSIPYCCFPGVKRLKTNLLITLALALLVLPMARTQATALTITGRELPCTCALATSAIPLDTVKVTEMTAGTSANLKAGAVNFTSFVGVVRARLSFDGSAADGDPRR